MDINTQKVLNEIIEKAKEENVALFIGAGASHAAGGPLGGKLTELVKAKFPKINQSATDFIEVCQDVIDTPPYNRVNLEDFITSKLLLLQPTAAHQIMTKYEWSAIFTTNFDDLIELAFRTSKLARKPCQPIFQENYQINPADRSRLYLFKIMGSMTATDGQPGSMVLSRSDRTNAAIRRRKYFSQLSDFVKSGTLLFIGYGFKDLVVFDAIDEIKSIYGEDRLPWSYALFDKIQLDDKTNYKFTSRKITPVQCDFESFFNYLDQNFRLPTRPTPVRNTHLKVGEHVLEISETDFRHLSEYFEILNEETLNEPPGKQSDFFMGTNLSWAAFKNNWDFRRRAYADSSYKRLAGRKEVIGCLKDTVLSELNKTDAEDNKVILLTGMPGVGKTMMLRRLAFDVYTSHKAPAVIIRSGRFTLDYRLLSGFIENINHQLNQKLPQGEHAPPLKPLIIIDDAGSLIRHVNQLRDYLTARGRSALIVASERRGEWDMMFSLFPFQLPQTNIFQIDEELDNQEKSLIIDHLSKLGYLDKTLLWDDILNKEYKNSFFATIYTTVHPSRKPLDQIIQDQFSKLTPATQNAYRNICCFHQFGIPINLELLVRSLRFRYEDFESEILRKDAAKVIFEEQDRLGNVFYRAHHKIISELTMAHFFPDPEMQKDIFQDIFKECTLTNSVERQLCEKLFFSHIGPNAKPQKFTYHQQRQLFQTICTKYPTRSLVHHWGVLETDDKQYSEAERLLKWALQLPRDDIEAYRGESDQVILTSLGNLYSHRGIEMLGQQDKQQEAAECFQTAETYFTQAKFGAYGNPHAYHAHAFLYYQRALKTPDESISLDYSGKALNVISAGKDNLNEGDLQLILELETQIWSHLGNESKIEQSCEVLRTKYGSASGYSLCALSFQREAQNAEPPRRTALLTKALALLDDGLHFFPSDENCLALKARIYKELHPQSLKKYYTILLKWKASATTNNAWLLFELARTSFILEYYDVSKKFFTELETGVGLAHRMRSRLQHPIAQADGTLQEFTGTIAKIFSPYEGEIRCDSLRNLRYNIPFRPVACKFEPQSGDLVRFNISFNFRNPFAINVRKV